MKASKNKCCINIYYDRAKFWLINQATITINTQFVQYARVWVNMKQSKEDEI